MKKRKGKLKIFTCLLSLMMIGTLLPTATFAEGEEEAEIRMESGVADLTVNASKVAFAGHEWWVIGVDESEDGNESGVYSQDGSITLLAANNEFGNTAFREGSPVVLENYKLYYYGSEYYYAENPDGMAWKTPNEYAGSTLQQKMEKIASEFQTSFPKECAFINGRNLTSDDGIAGQGINNQKLWALSEEEFKTIGDTGVASFANFWWLRSVFEFYGDNSYAVSPGGSYDYIPVSVNFTAVRPALSLDLSSVLFTSNASETGGKSLAFAAGNELIKISDLSTDSGAVKFTMKDKSQKLTVNATDAQSKQTGEELTFTYSEATTGDNQYISCILTDSNGKVAYYGKLKEISDSNNESGAITIPLENVNSGTYTLKIFSEEINGSLCTDFCSEPVTMMVTVDGGQGTVSDFSGTIIHEHDWGDPEWTWEEDYSGATATFICKNDESHVQTEQVKVTPETKEATCTEDGQKTYTAKVTFNGVEYTDTKEVAIPATGHDWNAPKWTWSEDYSGATATFICKNDPNHTVEESVTATSATTPAKVTFNNNTYEDTVTVTLPATGTTENTDSTDVTTAGGTSQDGASAADGSSSDTPGTGDDATLGLWAALLAVSGGLLALVVAIGRRRDSKGIR